MINLEEKTFDSIDENYAINNLCNEYYYQLMWKTKKVHLSKSRNFSKLKDTKPKDWENFLKLHKLCKDNNLDYKKYINFALDEVIKVHTYIHSEYLLNIKYIRLFRENEDIEQRYSDISTYIIASTNKIIEICKVNNLNSFTEFLKYVIKNKSLGHYLKSGVLSKYILALIPNIKEIKRFFDEESVHELDIYVINKYDKLNCDAITALQKHHNTEYINIIKKINLELQ